MASFCHKRVSTPRRSQGAACWVPRGHRRGGAAGVQALAQGPVPDAWRGLSQHSRPVAIQASAPKRERVIHADSRTAWILLTCLPQTQNI